MQVKKLRSSIWFEEDQEFEKLEFHCFSQNALINNSLGLNLEINSMAVSGYLISNFIK